MVKVGQTRRRHDAGEARDGGDPRVSCSGVQTPRGEALWVPSARAHPEEATEGRGVVSARRRGACGGGRSFGFERGEATEDGRDG